MLPDDQAVATERASIAAQAIRHIRDGQRVMRSFFRFLHSLTT